METGDELDDVLVVADVQAGQQEQLKEGPTSKPHSVQQDRLVQDAADPFLCKVGKEGVGRTRTSASGVYASNVP